MNKKAKLVLSAMLIGAFVFGALGVGPLFRIKANAVLRMDLTMADYKRFSETARTAFNIRTYASKVKPEFAGGNIDALVSRLGTTQWQSPVALVSREEMQGVPDALFLREQSEQQRERTVNAYMGLRISYVGSDKHAAVAATQWLGDYFRDVAVRESVKGLISRWESERHQFFDRAAELKLSLEFAQEQAQIRIDGFKRILSQYPDANRQGSAQVIEIRKESEKFLPPSVQLVAAEAEMLRAREDLRKLERDTQQYAFLKGLSVKLNEAASGDGTGADHLGHLTQVLTEAQKGAHSDSESQKAFQMLAEVSDIRSRYFISAYFIAPPEAMNRPEPPSPALLALLGAVVFGFMVSLWIWRVELLAALMRALNNEASFPKAAK